MSWASDFKTFITRGSVLDAAVGFIIGLQFKAVVTSLVNDVIMPPIGWITGGVNFNKLKWVIKAAGANGKGEVAISYGAFINTIITFLIICFVIFWMVRVISKMRKKKEEAPAAPPADVELLTEIRDLLKQRTGAA